MVDLKRARGIFLDTERCIIFGEEGGGEGEKTECGRLVEREKGRREGMCERVRKLQMIDIKLISQVLVT